MSRIFAEKFSPHSAENFCRGTRLCCRKFRVSKNSMHKRGMSQISIEKLLSHSTEDFREGILRFWKNCGFEKLYGWEGGITFFRRKFLVSHCRRISWASLHCFKKIGVSKNFMHNRVYHAFLSKVFGVTVPKNLVGIPSMFQKIWGNVKFYSSETEGVSSFSLETFWHTVPKTVFAEHFGVSEKIVYRKILCIKKGYH